ncbi:MAG: NADH-quinone oxidoreductase subunit J [Myxococcota bacterium]
MTVGNVFFALCSLVCLVGAVGTVIARNPIRGAMGLLATIVGIAGLFLQLSAQFLAAIQLIVYAGAVVVLFVFVIMLLGPDAAPAASRARGARWTGGVLAGLFALIAGGLSLAAQSAPAVPFRDAPAEHGTVASVGQLMFTKALVPFELATALLIVAVVGAIAVARARVAAPKRKPVQSPARLFAGPVHPRDAVRVASEGGRPLPDPGHPVVISKGDL